MTKVGWNFGGLPVTAGEWTATFVSGGVFLICVIGLFLYLERKRH